MNHLPYCPLVMIGGYLLGSISSAMLITWLWTRKDLRALNNRNTNAVSVARNVGIFPAALVVIVDFSKGAIPVLAARGWNLSDVCALSGAVSAVIGHSFPLYFGFRGGKGLAASFGALLVFTPLETLLVLPVLGLVYLVITGSAVTGALVSLVLLIGLNAWQGYPLVIILAPLVLLITMGLCNIPQVLHDWRQRDDKAELLTYWFSPKEQSAPSSRLAVITDSVASLPAEICAREKIHVVPMALILSDEVYRDGEDIEPRQYYRMLQENKLSPKTSAPSPGEYQELYKKLARSYNASIVITPPAELTQTWEAARLAGETVAGDFHVQVVDSRAAGPAEGFVALAAARMAAANFSLEDILQALESVKENVGFVGVLDTLNFLVEGGRVVEARRWIQSALHLYPVISLVHGQIRPVGMARTKTRAIRTMVNWLKTTLTTKGNLALAFCHTAALEEASALARELSDAYQPVESFITELTPVIGAHSGPGLVGVAWWVQSAV